MSIHDTIRFLQVIDELAALASEGDLATPKADGLFEEFIRLSPQELVVGMAKKYLDIGLDHIKLREKVEPGWPEQKKEKEPICATQVTYPLPNYWHGDKNGA